MGNGKVVSSPRPAGRLRQGADVSGEGGAHEGFRARGQGRTADEEPERRLVPQPRHLPDPGREGTNEENAAAHRRRLHLVYKLAYAAVSRTCSRRD